MLDKSYQVARTIGLADRKSKAESNEGTAGLENPEVCVRMELLK